MQKYMKILDIQPCAHEHLECLKISDLFEFCIFKFTLHAQMLSKLLLRILWYNIFYFFLEKDDYPRSLHLGDGCNHFINYSQISY